MDPLSDILSLIRPLSHSSVGLDAGAPWCVNYANPHEMIKCFCIVAGSCQLAIENEVLVLQAGDCFVLPTGRPFRMGSDLALPGEDSGRFLPPPQRGGVVRINGGGDCQMAGSGFFVEGRHARLLLDLLPPVMHIRGEADQATLRWCVGRMMQEADGTLPGAHLLGQHLAHIMFIEALREYMAVHPQGGRGWLFGIADAHLGAALRAIHAEPARRWTLQALAGLAAMSRSTFALRFRETVGLAPMAYVTRWRMFLAGERLSRSAEPVGQIATALGYESESAFSTAFKRVMGCSPRQFGRRRGAQAESG